MQTNKSKNKEKQKGFHRNFQDIKILFFKMVLFAFVY